eukprot:gene8779-10785_t
MIDHIGVNVSNFDESKKFYQKALAAIGYELILEFPASVTGSADVAGFGEGGKPDFWIASGIANNPPAHVAFRSLGSWRQRQWPARTAPPLPSGLLWRLRA